MRADCCLTNHPPPPVVAWRGGRDPVGTGDRIDIPARSIRLAVSDEELHRRREAMEA